MSNKIYTEEQVIDAITKAFLAEYPSNGNDILNQLTPIELPSDEEIENLIGDGMHNYYKGGFEEGAKWMKSKIQGGNK